MLKQFHEILKIFHSEIIDGASLVVRTQSDRLAAGLTALGLDRGDRVGIWSPNCIEWVLVQYAAARAGFILVSQSVSAADTFCLATHGYIISVFNMKCYASK